MPDGPAAYHFLHITVTGDTDLPHEGKAAARIVETYGYSRPPMVSYQDLLTNEGRYFQGQDYGTKGTHTQNDKDVPGYPDDLNLHGYALAVMQNVGDAVTDEQVHVAAKVYAARELLGLVRRGAPILPHRMFARKACPGDKAMARLDEIRQLKAHYVLHPPEEDDDMPNAKEVAQAVFDWSVPDPNHPHGSYRNRKFSGILVDTQRDIIALRAELAEIKRGQAALALVLAEIRDKLEG
jgi:hypothetical protein